MPKRIQLKRSAGWCKPPGAVVVARPSKWGNPFAVVRASSRRDGPLDMWAVTFHDETLSRWDDRPAALGDAVDRFRRAIEERSPEVPSIEEIRSELRGKDLCCWCGLDQPCHVDVYLELANPEGQS